MAVCFLKRKKKFQALKDKRSIYLIYSQKTLSQVKEEYSNSKI